ncbi:TcpQ domain-containing protein [Achromobacter aloeverae]
MAPSSFAATDPANTSLTYEFNWSIIGDANVSPRQIFDDGHQVYLQFAPSATTPAIFADSPGGLILLQPVPQSIYLVIPHMESRLQFQSGDRRARAQRAHSNVPPEGVLGEQATPTRVGREASPQTVSGSAQAPATMEQLQFRRSTADAFSRQLKAGDSTSRPLSSPATSAPSSTSSAAATTAVTGLTQQRLVDWDNKALGTTTLVESSTIASQSVGAHAAQVSSVPTQSVADSAPAAPAASSPTSDEAAPKHEAIKTLDVSAPSAVSNSEPKPLDVAPRTWDGTAGTTLQEMVRGWAGRAGWTVRWDTPLDYPIDAKFSITADTFLDAANQVFSAYQTTAHPFRVTAYSNNVLLVRGAQ